MCRGTLWLGNAAYLYLSVSFIQMLKALMPVAVFGVGCGMGTETYSLNTLLNMIVVTIGVAIASYGEINFVVIGVVLQLLSVMTESTRLTLVSTCAAGRLGASAAALPCPNGMQPTPLRPLTLRSRCILLLCTLRRRLCLRQSQPSGRPCMPGTVSLARPSALCITILAALNAGHMCRSKFCCSGGGSA